MFATVTRSSVFVSALFVSSLLLTGCGGDEKTGEAPPLSPAAQKANDAYVNQIAKDAMKNKSKEKPATNKAAPGVAPGPGGN
jgi:outer membrane murein-binding lipoprotein Lpp